MKMSEIFERAAKGVANDTGVKVGACWHIARIERGFYEEPAQEYFGNLFDQVGFVYWWPIEDQDSRVVALLFAAAIARSEGK